MEDVHPDDILDSLAISFEYGPLTLLSPEPPPSPEIHSHPEPFSFLFVRTMRKKPTLWPFIHATHQLLFLEQLPVWLAANKTIHF